MKPSLLLDTCALLDLVTERWVKPDVISVFEESVHPAILSVSVWEISRKFRLGKLSLPCDQSGILAFVREVCDYYAISIVPVSDIMCHEAEILPLHHRDPFDRMILAAASLAGCPVVSSDRNFQQYDVKHLEHR